MSRDILIMLGKMIRTLGSFANAAQVVKDNVIGAEMDCVIVDLEVGADTGPGLLHFAVVVTGCEYLLLLTLKAPFGAENKCKMKT
jgi:hypothetical protein